MTCPCIYLYIHPSIYPSYSPSTSLFTEQITPDPLQMTPRLSIHTSISRPLTVRRPHCSLRWNRHGSMSVMAAPVTLPVKPINRENLGTSRASRYDVISKAPRTNRAGRDIPPRPPASVERLKQRERAKQSFWQLASNFCLWVAQFWLTVYQLHSCIYTLNLWNHITFLKYHIIMR